MAVTSVASVTTVGGVQFLPVNSARKELIVANTDANALYVLLGRGTVSSSFYSFKLAQGEEKEPNYAWTGEVWGIWDADGSGVALITEY